MPGSTNRRLCSVRRSLAIVLAAVSAGCSTAHDAHVHSSSTDTTTVGTTSTTSVPPRAATTSPPTATEDTAPASSAPPTSAEPPPPAGSDAAIARGLMIDPTALGAEWHRTDGPAIGLDRSTITDIEGCVNIQHLVFDPLAFPRTTESRWLTDDQHQPISQFAAVFADNVVAATFDVWLNGPLYAPDCGEQFYDEWASSPCCGGDEAVLPRISSGPEVEVSIPPQREVGTTVRRTDVFWTDAAGRRHGPETRLTALVRIGRAITTLEVVESGEDGVVVTPIEEFEQVLGAVIAAGLAQMPQAQPQRADVPALGGALTMDNLGDDAPPRLMVDLEGWQTSEYQTQELAESTDGWSMLELTGEGSIWEAPKAAVTVVTGDLSSDFGGDPVSIRTATGTIRSLAMDGVQVVIIGWKPDPTYFAFLNASRVDVDVALAIARSLTIVDGEPRVEPVPDVFTRVQGAPRPRRSAIYGFANGERSVQVNCTFGMQLNGAFYPAPTGSTTVAGIEVGYMLGRGTHQSPLGSAVWMIGPWMCHLNTMASGPPAGGIATLFFTPDELVDVLSALVVVDEATFQSGLSDARVLIDGEQVQP